MSEKELPEAKHHIALSAHVTTALLSSIAAFSASLLYFHYFPQVRQIPAPIAVVDMVRLSASLAQMSSVEGDTQVFMNAGHAVAMLKERGYIVIDSRMVIAAPDEYVKKPSDLVAGAPDDTPIAGGYVPPNLTEGSVNAPKH